jgi:hypothetical protein
VSKQDIDRLTIGEHWAYRARAVDRLDEVAVQRFGSKSPPRVLIRFVDPAQEGREEWVPPGRLKAPWTERDAFLERERRWAAVRDVVYLRDTPEGTAIGMVFDSLPDWQFARDGYNDDTGVLFIHDVAAAVHLLAITTWAFAIRERWVHEQAITYAERLFETLEQDESTSAPPPT